MRGARHCGAGEDESAGASRALYAEVNAPCQVAHDHGASDLCSSPRDLVAWDGSRAEGEDAAACARAALQARGCVLDDEDVLGLEARPELLQLCRRQERVTQSPAAE